MAGIAGIFCADGRPADVAELRRMVAGVEHRGPDGIGYWNAGPVALAHLQFCTTPESLEERQPLMSPGGEACLVWNGRVDNREELLAELEAAGARVFDRTDAGLALAAYLAWGPECVQKIVGDFALTVWDARERRLWCARDYIGIRPFYYFWDGKTFLFGPEIRALLEHPLVSLKINEGMVGEYLADDFVTRDETLYADIQRLPGGCMLTIEGPGSLRIQNWWNPELSLLDYKTDEEYGEHFRELFDQAVRAQLRSQGPVGISLSGGLDSSSIAVTAQELLRREGRTDRFWAFSLVGPGRAWDESEDIHAIVRHARLNAETVQLFAATLEHFQNRAVFWREFPGVPNGEPMTIPICEATLRHGSRIVLSGLGGDEWLQGYQAHLVDLACTGAITRMLRRARDDWEFFSGVGSWQSYLGRQLLRAMAPHWAFEWRRKRRLAGTDIFSDAFLRRTQLGDRLYGRVNASRHFATRAQKTVFEIITGAFEAFVLEGNDLELVYGGAEMRFPFHNRRVAEFCIRLPEEQRQQGGMAKRVLRRAMGERLPEQLQKKTVKAEYSDMFAALVHEPQAKMRLQKLAMAGRTDWLDRRRFASGQLSRLNDSRLWMMLGVDLWLGQVLSREGDAGPAR